MSTVIKSVLLWDCLLKGAVLALSHTSAKLNLFCNFSIVSSSERVSAEIPAKVESSDCFPLCSGLMVGGGQGKTLPCLFKPEFSPRFWLQIVKLFCQRLWLHLCQGKVFWCANFGKAWQWLVSRPTRFLCRSKSKWQRKIVQRCAR